MWGGRHFVSLLPSGTIDVLRAISHPKTEKPVKQMSVPATQVTRYRK
jgi:hypothetical protein